MVNNGTIQKKIRSVFVDGRIKKYKVANQALYSTQLPTDFILWLEIFRKSKTRVQIQTKSGKTFIGYIRHVEVDGEKYPMLFFRKNSKKANPLPSNDAIAVLRTTGRYKHVYYSKAPNYQTI